VNSVVKPGFWTWVTARKRSPERPNLDFTLCENGIVLWILPLYNGSMPTKVSIDKAGRLVLPKALREEMHLGPGDDLLVENEGDRITLRPVRPDALLKKEHGIWVYQGETSDLSIPKLIDEEREKRLREIAR
jgi:AbrB family looped-hinge helix DNA binding protein